MSVDIIFPLSLGLIFGSIFFIVDVYNENKTREIQTSLIAGVTITYFFIILLPEIEIGLEHFPFELFRYVGILIGFCTIHLTEKFILLRVENKSQLKLKELYKEEAEITLKEKKIEKSLIKKIIGDDEKKNSYMKIAERLFALREICKMQYICFEKEKNLEEKLDISNNNSLAILNKLSALKQISKMHEKCVEEERKLHSSLLKKLLPNEQDKSSVRDRDLLVKLNMLKELYKKEVEFLEIEQNLENIVIKNYMNNHQNQDRLSEEDLSLKFSELKNISKIHEDCVEREDDLEEAMLFTLKEDYVGGDQEFRLVGQVCALQEIAKFQEFCYLEEKELEEDIIEGDIDKLSILSNLSALNEISTIRSLYLEEEEILRKSFRDALQESHHTQLSNEDFIENLNSYERIRKEQKESMIKERDLENSLVKGLMGDNQKKLSLLELTENLLELKNSFMFQAECIEKEKMFGASVLDKIMDKEDTRLNLSQIASKLNTFCQREEELEMQNTRLKAKIQNHINDYLDLLHQYTNFGYHLLIGIILFELLVHEYTTGILFFVFAFFKALISKTSNKVQLFPSIEIKSGHHEPLYKEIFFASSAVFGVLIGVILTVVFHISMDIVFIMFSFISGVILYTIIREVLPENESGKPLYFLLGIILFIIVIVVFESVLSLFSHH
ncbi:MAG: hypothetical protein KGD65_12300 [Candidatus Lokiarchaeota archaeon]|nr:hypothetical protein [Candidatus Lokiarchaeota archaeon]